MAPSITKSLNTVLDPELGGLFHASVSLCIKWGCARHTLPRASVETEHDPWPARGQLFGCSRCYYGCCCVVVVIPICALRDQTRWSSQVRRLQLWRFRFFQDQKFQKPRDRLKYKTVAIGFCSTPWQFQVKVGGREREGGREDQALAQEGLKFITATLKIPGRLRGPPRPQGWANTIFVGGLCWVSRANSPCVSVFFPFILLMKEKEKKDFPLESQETRGKH